MPVALPILHVQLVVLPRVTAIPLDPDRRNLAGLLVPLLKVPLSYEVIPDEIAFIERPRLTERHQQRPGRFVDRKLRPLGSPIVELQKLCLVVINEVLDELYG